MIRKQLPLLPLRVGAALAIVVMTTTAHAGSQGPAAEDSVAPDDTSDAGTADTDDANSDDDAHADTVPDGTNDDGTNADATNATNADGGSDDSGEADSDDTASDHADRPSPPQHQAVLGPTISPATSTPDLVINDGAPHGKKKKKYDIDLALRVVSGLRHRRRNPSAEQPAVNEKNSTDFRLRQVRVGIKARYKRILSAKASFDLADLLDQPSGGKVIRDGWANIRVHRAFQIKVGQFKRPYSRLELRGVSKIPFVGRGLFNDTVVEDLGWGDRAVGGMVWGRVKPKSPGLHRLTWQISASNDVVADAPDGLDTHARVQYEPTAWLSIGAGGAYKSVDDPLDERREVFGAGGDIALEFRGLYAAVEANAAQDWTFADQSPWALGLVSYVSYDWKLGKRTALQPVAAFELVDANLSFAESEAVRAVANVNVLWTKHLRIMPQVEFVQPLSPVTDFNPFVRTQTYALWVSVQL